MDYVEFEVGMNIILKIKKTLSMEVFKINNIFKNINEFIFMKNISSVV